MRSGILILMAGLTLSACHSSKEMRARRARFVRTEPVEVSVQETEGETSTPDKAEVPLPTKTEKVVKTAGSDLKHYCVILGSFIHRNNAENLRNNLIDKGFTGTSILRNEKGMYRVSVVCSDSRNIAWQEVCRIRREYSQFHDAWLLETVKTETDGIGK